MKYEEIKKLMDDMGESKLTAIDIEFPDGIKISMKKEGIRQEIIKQDITPVVQPVQSLVNTVVAEKVEEKQVEGNVVKSPMVGTFYSKSSPTANKFVEIGSKVKKGDVLCIIEAMKLMNEIESEFDGEVVEICAKNEEMVEYGKPLFKIKKECD